MCIGRCGGCAKLNPLITYWKLLSCSHQVLLLLRCWSYAFRPGEENFIVQYIPTQLMNSLTVVAIKSWWCAYWNDCSYPYLLGEVFCSSCDFSVTHNVIKIWVFWFCCKSYRHVQLSAIEAFLDIYSHTPTCSWISIWIFEYQSVCACICMCVRETY